MSGESTHVQCVSIQIATGWVFRDEDEEPTEQIFQDFLGHV